MQEIRVPVKNKVMDCFKLYLLELNERDAIFRIFPEDNTVFQTEWFSQLYPAANSPNASPPKKLPKAGSGVIRLRPGLHHVLFNDQDHQGNDHPIRIFLSEDVLVIIGYPLLHREKVLEWADRGIIDSPLDLVQILGMRVLHHHQTRLEAIESQMDQLEEEILNAPVSHQQRKIIGIHRRVIRLKKSLNRHLAAFERLKTLDSRSSSPWQELTTETERELENIRQTYELVESLREAYQAAVDNRANDIMKLLTLLATILLPINLLTSFFGMNFNRMPLLENPNGIYIFYAGCFIILALGIFYFWKKNWLK